MNKYTPIWKFLFGIWFNIFKVTSNFTIEEVMIIIPIIKQLSPETSKETLIFKTDNNCITPKQADDIMNNLQSKGKICFPEYGTQYIKLEDTLVEKEKVILGI